MKQSRKGAYGEEENHFHNLIAEAGREKKSYSPKNQRGAKKHCRKRAIAIEAILRSASSWAFLFYVTMIDILVENISFEWQIRGRGKYFSSISIAPIKIAVTILIPFAFKLLPPRELIKENIQRIEEHDCHVSQREKT